MLLREGCLLWFLGSEGGVCDVRWAGWRFCEAEGTVCWFGEAEEGRPSGEKGEVCECGAGGWGCVELEGGDGSTCSARWISSLNNKRTMPKSKRTMPSTSSNQGSAVEREGAIGERPCAEAFCAGVVSAKESGGWEESGDGEEAAACVWGEAEGESGARTEEGGGGVRGRAGGGGGGGM